MLTRKDKKVVFAALSIFLMFVVVPALAARQGRSRGGNFTRGGGRSGVKSSQVARPARSGGRGQGQIHQRRPAGGRRYPGGKRPQLVITRRPLPNKRTIHQKSPFSTSNREAAQLGRSRSVIRTRPKAFETFKKTRRTFNVRVKPRRRGRRHIGRDGSTAEERTQHFGRTPDRRTPDRSRRGDGLKFVTRSKPRFVTNSKPMFVVNSKTPSSRFERSIDHRRERHSRRGDRHSDHRFGRRHQRRHNRIIWPRRRHIVYYRHGSHFRFRYVYPRHHRKYIFVSLGGYWPLHYRHARYYWYGWHPYQWYGYYPAAYEVAGATYNYYTYNYGGETVDEETGALKGVDADTFADVREKLAEQAAREPATETEVDRLFDEGVKAFEAGDYRKAADKFADASRLEPEDVVLPFAYAQALFADEEYVKAAKELRQAVGRLPEGQLDVFYPRGLYPDEETLLEQIDTLADKTESYGGDIELLLGYQLLGTGKHQQAQDVLEQIEPDSKNAATAEILLGLLEKVKTPASEAEKVEDGDTY